MNRRYLHMSVPGPVLPLFVVLVGRRRCCGTRWRTRHLNGCCRQPWIRRDPPLSPTEAVGTLDAAVPGRPAC